MTTTITSIGNFVVQEIVTSLSSFLDSLDTSRQSGNQTMTTAITPIGDLVLQEDVSVTIAGTVVAIDDDEFLLQDNTGQILVDPVRRIEDGLDLSIGDNVTVTGEYDDFEDFDAVSVVPSDNPIPPTTPGEIIGDSNPNRLRGTRNNDIIRGEGGDDTLIGRQGNDFLVGGAGSDRLTGGEGRDEFVYEAIGDAGDTITDFDPNQDVVNLQQIFADPSYSRAFTRYLDLEETFGGSVVRIDPDGDLGNAESIILFTLEGVSADSLSASNAIV